MMFNYPYPQRKKLKKEMRKNDFKTDFNFIKQFNYEK